MQKRTWCVIVEEDMVAFVTKANELEAQGWCLEPSSFQVKEGHVWALAWRQEW